MTTLHFIARGLGTLMLVLAALWCAGLALLLNRSQAHLEAWPTDFAVFWQVARLALEGEIARAFDTAAMAPVWQLPSTAAYAWEPLWLYPPTWALVIAPFGLLPFSLAYALYTALSLGLFALVLRGPARVLPGGVMFLFASPGMLAAVMLGNTGLLTAPVAAAALMALASGRPLRAGGLTALMAVKPQFGLMLAIAAFAARSRAMVAVAAAGTLGFATLATLVFGTGYWALFLETLGAHDGGLRAGGDYQAAVAAHGYLDLSFTPYAFARQAGLPDGAALALHLALAVAGAGVAALGWHRLMRARAAGGTPPDRLAAAVIALSLVMIPLLPHRALPYEAAFLLAAVPFLWAAGAAAHWPGRLALAIAWFGVPRPVFDMAGLPVGGTMAPLVMLLACYAAWQVLAALQAAGAGRAPAIAAEARGT